MAPFGKSFRVITGWCNDAREARRPSSGRIEPIASSLEAFDLHSEAKTAAPNPAWGPLRRCDRPSLAHDDVALAHDDVWFVSHPSPSRPAVSPFAPAPVLFALNAANSGEGGLKDETGLAPGDLQGESLQQVIQLLTSRSPPLLLGSHWAPRAS